MLASSIRMQRTLAMAGRWILGASIMVGCAPVTASNVRSAALYPASSQASHASAASAASAGVGAEDDSEALASVFLAQAWKSRPQVCASITTVGATRSKSVAYGKSCMEELPAYCQSSTLLPGFDNSHVRKAGAQKSATSAKEAICKQAMRGSVALWESKWEGKGPYRDQMVVWSTAKMVDQYGFAQYTTARGEPIDNYCASSVLAYGVSDAALKEHNAYEHAVDKKKTLCDKREAGLKAQN